MAAVGNDEKTVVGHEWGTTKSLDGGAGHYNKHDGWRQGRREPGNYESTVAETMKKRRARQL